MRTDGILAAQHARDPRRVGLPRAPIATSEPGRWQDRVMAVAAIAAVIVFAVAWRMGAL